jgi:putative alpha-1,2-mannosidase
MNYKTIYNAESGFMEARDADGTFAGPDNGWTEGDKWAYTFDVVHDIPGLIELKGGNKSFVEFLDSHFEGGREYAIFFSVTSSNIRVDG